MSNGWGTYRVVSARELERQRLAAAQARYTRACQEADRVTRTIATASRSMGDLYVDPPRRVRPRGADAAAVERAAIETEAAKREALGRYESGLARARSRAMVTEPARRRRTTLVDNADRERAERITAREAAAAARQAAPEVPEADVVAERVAEVERVAGRLPASVDDQTGDRARKTVAQALAAARDSVGAYRAAIAGLRGLVQQAQDAERARRATLATVEQLRLEIDGLEGAAVEAVRARLDSVDPDAPLPPDLGGEVAAAAAAASAARDRSFALVAMAETLGDLGYEVTPGFSTAVDDAGSVVQLPWSRQHGVQVREHAGTLLFNVVRIDRGAADSVSDLRAEQRFCAGYGDLVAAARGRGIALDLGPPAAPGVQPLQHVRVPAGTGEPAAAGDEAETQSEGYRERGR